MKNVKFMKNLSRIKLGKTLFMIASVFALCCMLPSCKQDAQKGGDKKNSQQNNPAQSMQDEVVVTVAKDAHVVKCEPNSFKVEKGKKLGLSELRAKFSVKFEGGWEFAKLCLSDVNGKEITDENKYTFGSNATIFVVSKQKSLKPVLDELKVDGTAIPKISENMNAGITKNEKVRIEAKYSPNDANISFTPEIQNNEWGLQIGKNALTITVSKGAESKSYTVNIERVNEETPVLAKIVVGSQVKEGAQITTDRPIGIGVPVDAEKLPISVETKPEGAKVKFEAAVKDGMVTLNPSSYSTDIKITVGEGEKAIKYRVILKKVVSEIAVYGGRKQGVRTMCKQNEVRDVRTHAEDAKIVVSGPFAKILVVSNIVDSMSFEVNGVKSKGSAVTGFRSAQYAIIPLGEKGSITSVEMLLSAVQDNVKEKFSFKIHRADDVVDVPCNEMIIAGKKVILEQDEIFEGLWKNPLINFAGSEPTTIEVLSEADMSVSMDGKADISAEKKEIGGLDVWYAKDSVSNVDGREIIVVVSPKDTQNYSAVTWKFNLAYKEPKALPVEWEINGKKDEQDINQAYPGFMGGVNSDTNPTINIDSSYLNLKLKVKAPVASIKIEGETIQGDALVTEIDGSITYHILNRAIKLENDAKQVEIEIIAKDPAVYAKRNFRFMAKGSSTLEKLNPKFAAISDDKSLSQVDFVDKLVNDKPSYKLPENSSTGRLVITCSLYEKEFLLDKLIINNDKVQGAKKDDGRFNFWYEFTKDVELGTDSSKDVVVQFMPKNGVADSLKWEFVLEKGGKKPSIPYTHLYFKVRGLDYADDPFGAMHDKADLHEKLTNGSKPKYKINGATVKIIAGHNRTYQAPDGTYQVITPFIKSVECKMDGKTVATAIPPTSGNKIWSQPNFSLPDHEEHEIEVIMYPTDEETYSPLKYTFILQKK